MPNAFKTIVSYIFFGVLLFQERGLNMTPLYPGLKYSTKYFIYITQCTFDNFFVSNSYSYPMILGDVNVCDSIMGPSYNVSW